MIVDLTQRVPSSLNWDVSTMIHEVTIHPHDWTDGDAIMKALYKHPTVLFAFEGKVYKMLVNTVRFDINGELNVLRNLSGQAENARMRAMAAMRISGIVVG